MAIAVCPRDVSMPMALTLPCNLSFVSGPYPACCEPRKGYYLQFIHHIELLSLLHIIDVVIATSVHLAQLFFTA